MNNEIAIAPEQVEELLTLTYNFGTVTDIITARNIYKESIKQAGGVCSEWEFSCALGNILRIGYIMGQRAERRRTHTHTHRAALTSGGSAARTSERGLLRNE